MVVWAKRLQKQFPYDDTAASGVPNVVRTGLIEFVPVIEAAVLDAVVIDPELRQIVETLDLRSSIIVPLRGGLGTLGALQLVRTSTRPTFTAAEVQLASDLAGPIGAALNNTILFRRQQDAQHALEGLQRLTARLADLSTVADIATAVIQSSAGLCAGQQGPAVCRRAIRFVPSRSSGGIRPGRTERLGRARRIRPGADTGRRARPIADHSHDSTRDQRPLPLHVRQRRR